MLKLQNKDLNSKIEILIIWYNLCKVSSITFAKPEKRCSILPIRENMKSKMLFLCLFIEFIVK